MYSKLTEYMNNYGRVSGRRGAKQDGRRERERKRGELDLIDKVDLSATRGRVYVHLAWFFRPRPAATVPGNHSFPPRLDIIRDVNVPSCAPRASVYAHHCSSSLVFVLSPPSIFFSFLFFAI